MAIANDDSINELISKHLAGEASMEEERQLRLWLNVNEDNKHHFNSIKKTFDLATSHVEIPALDSFSINVDDEWEHFRQKVGGKGNVRKFSSSQLWLRIAASLLLILVAGAVVYYYSQTDTFVFQTAGNTETVSLPDGSLVTLNRNSTLSYDEDFGDKTRNLILRGEAFFDVTKDTQKPFIIHADNARVRVVGTTFNINAYDSLKSVEVIVETGIVSLEAVSGGSSKIEILAGEIGKISRSTQRISVALNEDLNFQAWNTRHLVFVDEHLASVIRTLEKAYGTQVSMRTEIPASCILNATFDNQSLESVMRVLENTLNLKFTIKNNKVEITEAGC